MPSTLKSLENNKPQDFKLNQLQVNPEMMNILLYGKSD